MDEAHNHEPPHDGQVRRAQDGIVAGYIHSLSERHGHAEVSPSGMSTDGQGVRGRS